MKRIALFSLLILSAISLLPGAAQETPDLTGIKTYLLDHVTVLDENADRLERATQAYYELAQAANFDYSALWINQRLAVTEALLQARDAWLVASPLYEQVEGVVAGVPSLSEYDVILDAGASGAEDPEGGVPFNLNLPDGRVLERPGNLFGVLEGTLWGTKAEYSSGVWADLNLNSSRDFGEWLPEANVLVSAALTTHQYTQELLTSSQSWEPTIEDAFTALVVMVPTMSEYFGSWKESRFIAGDAATRSDFAVISRLSDIKDILGGLIVVYDGVSPAVQGVDSAQDTQIRAALVDLLGYVDDLRVQEADGRQFTPEEADIFGSEAQNRAQATTGQIAQIAALLNIELPE